MTRGSSIEPLARGDAQLQLDDVEARHGLGDRVLDLDAPVQLEEEEALRRERELRGAGAAVGDRLGERDRGGVELRAQPGSSPGAGASSRSFWWRRWTEQSRSPSASTARARRR